MRPRVFLLCALLALMAALAAALLTGALQRAWDSGRLVAGLARAPDAPAGLALRDIAVWSEDGVQRQGTLYRPANRPAEAALVLVPGADRAGKQHPLFVAFAETLAAAGFLVLVPDIESLRALQLSAADAARIAGAVAHMAERPEGQRGVVLAAISYAVGPAVLAALRPDVAARIPAVLGIGGYHDAKAAVTFFTTGGFRGPQGDWQRQAATNHGRWVFLRANLQRLSSPEDRRLLLELARLRAAAPQAPVAHLTTRLGPEGRAVWALLSNREPARSRALIGALPAGIRRELEALDLSARDLSDLQAELILVHGRDDPVLPYTGSQALAAAAPEARLYLLDSLRHVELDAAGLGDGWRLFSAAWRLLSLRDRLATDPA